MSDAVVFAEIYKSVKIVVQRPLWRSVDSKLRLRRLANPVVIFNVVDDVHDDLIGGPRILYVPWDRGLR
jgi:hypothetical protein